MKDDYSFAPTSTSSNMMSPLSRRRLDSGRRNIITTPVENDDDDTSYYHTTKHSLLHPTTPSPQAVDEFDQAVTSANRSAEVSKLISDHLVVLTPTPGVCITEDEVIMDEAKVSLPELEEHQNNNNEYSISEDYSIPPTYSTLPPQMKSIMNNIRSSNIRTTSTRPLSPNSLSHKMLFSSVSSIVSPPQHFNLQQQSLLVGEERQVIFHNVSLGIKISRHSDGYVRVLSITPPTSSASKREGDSTNVEDKPARTGDEIHVGDVVRQVSDVNLRMPIDSAVWKLTVGLIKMAPRPLTFIVAKEIKKQEEKRDDEIGSKRGLYRWPSRADRTAASEEASVQEPETTTAPQPSHFFTGPTRTIHFLESALGVKLHHNTSGYVQILSVAPYKSFPNSPLARTGDSIYAGDVVLEVGGVWNLREPIDKVGWSTLITFIKESKRPLSMVVGDADSLMIPKKDTELSLEKEAEAEANDLALSEAEEESKSCQDKKEDIQEKTDQEEEILNESDEAEEIASSLEDKGLEEAVSSTEAEETAGNEDREEKSNECNVDDSTAE